MGAAMYSSFPKPDRVRIRISLTLAWFFVAVGGAYGVVTPSNITEQVGFWLPFLSSLSVAVFGGLAAIGVAINEYRLEWVAAWFATGGVFVYAVAVWYLSIIAGNYRFQAAALLTALIFFFSYRIVACAAHARKIRTIHDLIVTGETEIPNA